MWLSLGTLLWSVRLCSQSSISRANGDWLSQIEKHVVVSAFSVTSGRGCGGKVICYKKVQHSFLNQNLDQDYIGGRGTFALKRGQRWNSPKLVLFHKCFRAQRGRISSLLPKCAGQNYVTWHALHDCTESWFACGSSTVVFVHCPGGKWNCYCYKFKFFIHFLLEVFPGNLLRSSMDS